MLTDVAPVGLPEHRLPHFWDAWNHVLVSPASNSSPTPLLRPSLLKSKLGQEASLGLLDSQLFYKRPLGCGGPALPLTGSLPPVVLRSQLQISSLPCDPRVTMRLHLGTCYSFHPEYPCSSSSIFKLQLVIHALSPPRSRPSWISLPITATSTAAIHTPNWEPDSPSFFTF